MKGESCMDKTLNIIFLDGAVFEQLALGFYMQSRWSLTLASLTYSVLYAQIWIVRNSSAPVRISSNTDIHLIQIHLSPVC